uniref:Uncharacterized protein n=1 Tax=viral metagenome TaxID=1070528 RepID=A0A6M3X6K8_9ZZZZ
MTSIVPLLPLKPKQGEKFRDEINEITWIYLGTVWKDYDEFIKAYKAFNDTLNTETVK